MTDVVRSGTEWVPRIGMLEVSPERAAVIRGLFELAAFVADHPGLPLPFVSAVMVPPALGLQREIGVVGEVARVLGVTPATTPDGACVAQRRFGRAVQVKCLVRPVVVAAGVVR
ncbi:hypothetical protein HPO96_29360 [Kribbella sandramycini]|uniref:Uncharacterized protein n=1 Tax=Kribbella sandramycini TaxID=60450 RepID=A0A7Y4L4R4_9ACTN|nr:hypothetical protein [Kribbella sandramycini]MBB6571720.1 hypothetical protein [Kribbella sandramycini]NOL44363.1 hypothetical protein [Kribbella sandramycini]